ncbi:hypothetical protein ACE6H2_024920 [Prunus campanulata]
MGTLHPPTNSFFFYTLRPLFLFFLCLFLSLSLLSRYLCSSLLRTSTVSV